MAAEAYTTGLSIPSADYVAYTYFGSTNNIQTATFKVGGASGTTVATVTFTYVASGAADNDRVLTATVAR